MFVKETGIQFHAQRPPERSDDIENGLNLIKSKKALDFHPRPSTYSAELMAKKSWIARDKKKAETVKRYAELRAQLKAEKDYIGLTMLPRNASPTRTVNRCLVSGRRRAFIRRFKLSRISFRELANAGMIPGVTKSSW